MNEYRKVRFVSANLHNEAEAVARLLALKPHIAGVHEAQKVRRPLLDAEGFDYHTGWRTPDRNMTQETGVLARPGMELFGRSTRFMSEEFEGAPRIGMERYGTSVTLQVTPVVRVAVLPWHPIAGPDALNGRNGGGSNAIRKRYWQGVEWLDETIRFHKRVGDEVVVLADCQMFKTWDWPWSPKKVFERHDMGWFWERIDVVAWTRGMGTPKTGTHEIGSNHKALRADFTVRR